MIYIDIYFNFDVIHKSLNQSQAVKDMLWKPGLFLALILILFIIHYTYGGSIEDKYFCKRNHQKGNRARIIGGHEARAGKTLFLTLCQTKKCLKPSQNKKG